MQIELTGHHVDITPALRDYVHEKLARIDDRQLSRLKGKLHERRA